MITKQTTKRAAKILAERKEKYAREFERAKGDSKAIARAAAEYRSIYGKTPLKRWHNALSQAAKETATHERPRKKTAVAPATNLRPAAQGSKPAAAKPATNKKPTAKRQPKYKVPFFILMKDSGKFKVEPYKRLYYVDKVANAGTTFNYYCWSESTCRLPKARRSGVRLTEEEMTKECTFPSDSTVNNILTNHRTKLEQEAAKQKEDEKRQKEERKAMLKKNPEWIKSFAKQTGLSSTTIDSLYKLCSKDDLRPVLNGVYVSDKGELVATDAHVLAAVNANAPKSLRGKIFAPSGKTIEGRFPNHDAILVSRGKAIIWVGHDQVRRNYDYVDNKPSAVFKDSKGNECLEIGNQRYVADLYNKLMRLFASFKESPLCLQTGEESTSTGFVSKSVRSVLMPILKG